MQTSSLKLADLTNEVCRLFHWSMQTSSSSKSADSMSSLKSADFFIEAGIEVCRPNQWNLQTFLEVCKHHYHSPQISSALCRPHHLSLQTSSLKSADLTNEVLFTLLLEYADIISSLKTLKLKSADFITEVGRPQI